MRYTVDPGRELPIYRQLADGIYADILRGDLAQGDRLPTVRELAEELDLARGTVKRAYEELRQRGAVEMTQGRGTFVSYEPRQAANRKEIAMAAMDEMFAKLEELSFTPAEIAIYLNLKLRLYTSQERMVQAALVDCNPETLSQLTEQLTALRGVEVHPFLLSEVAEQPYRLEEGMDLILTSNLHAQEVSRMLTDGQKLAQVVLTPSPETVMALTRLAAGKTIGIVCRSPRFAAMAVRDCETYSRAAVTGTFLLGGPGLAEFAAGKDILLLPVGYERLCREEERDILREAERKRRVILHACGADRGSMLHLEERIEDLRRKRI